MPYRPRELVVRAREAAALLLSALERNEMVERFLDIYAAENRRPGRADQPSHYQEQVERIRREALLAMVLRVETALPERLKVQVAVRSAPRKRSWKKRGHRNPGARKKAAKPTLELAIPFLDLFREEFFVALGQALRWTGDDADEFWRDLEFYEKLSDAKSHRARRYARGDISGPFVDRTAILLDPSLMEQARRAASRFHLEVEAAADKVLRKVFSRRGGR